MTRKIDHKGKLSVVGLPEKSEGSHPTSFMETLLAEVFGGDSFPVKPTVDLRSPQPNRPPRAMIALLHHYRMRELILCLSWEQAGQLTYRGQKISFYPDLSSNLVRRRAAFNPVKKQLQVAGVKYSFAYPATLWFTLNGSKQEFKSPQDASAFVKANTEKIGKCRGSQSVDMPKLEDSSPGLPEERRWTGSKLPAGGER